MYYLCTEAPLMHQKFFLWVDHINVLRMPEFDRKADLYQKLTFFCKAHNSIMNLVVNAVFGVDVSITITYLLHPMLPWKH